jgi:hypothetical protein
MSWDWGGTWKKERWRKGGGLLGRKVGEEGWGGRCDGTKGEGVSRGG